MAEHTDSPEERPESPDNSGLEQPSPKRVRTPRVKYANNPFLRDVVATLGDKRVAVAMKANLMELDNDTGELTHIPGQITKMISADRESFVKLYTAQIDAFFELSKPGRTVVKYLIWLHQREANSHLFILHHSQVAESGLQISRSTWFDGIADLIEKKIIAPSTVTNAYFLNPAVFFNGDRTRLVIEVRKMRRTADAKAELEALGQKRLEDV